MNGFEFTNRFSNSKRDLPTLFERTAADLGIQHKLIRPYTPRHNGKVERSHREDRKHFYYQELCEGYKRALISVSHPELVDVK